MSLEDRVDEIAGADGWWRPAGRCVYVKLARQLVARGLTAVEAIDILARAYDAAAGEFGK